MLSRFQTGPKILFANLLKQQETKLSLGAPLILQGQSELSKTNHESNHGISGICFDLSFK